MRHDRNKMSTHKSHMHLKETQRHDHAQEQRLKHASLSFNLGKYSNKRGPTQSVGERTSTNGGHAGGGARV